jgi:hypothetical protein
MKNGAKKYHAKVPFSQKMQIIPFHGAPAGKLPYYLLYVQYSTNTDYLLLPAY